MRAKRITNPHAAVQSGPIYVVLGPQDDLPGVYQPRPENVGCGRFFELFPIVIVLKPEDLKDAFRLDSLNDLIAGIPASQLGDKDVVIGTLEQSDQLYRCFMDCKKFNALRVAAETGIYCGLDWDAYILKFTKYPKLEQKSFNNFLDAIKFMLNKDHMVEEPASVSVSRAHSPVKRTGSPPFGGADSLSSRSSSPTKLPPLRHPSPSKGLRVKPESITRAATLPPSGVVCHHSGLSASTARQTPASPSRARGTPISRFQPSTTPKTPYGVVSASPTRAMPSYTNQTYDVDVDDQAKEKPDDEVANQLDRLNLGSGARCTMSVDELRSFVRPANANFPDYDPAIPPLFLGPRVDLWLSTRAYSPGTVLGILQVFLYSENVAEFKKILSRPPIHIDASDTEYLWMLLCEWFNPDWV